MSDLIFPQKMYLPPNKKYPQELPEHWKSEDGTILNLQTLSDEELHSLGWHGPIETPSSESYFTHSNKWNPDTLSFDYVELSREEKCQRVNYRKFLKDLTISLMYKRVRKESKLSLEVNALATEFISLINCAIVSEETQYVKNIDYILNELLLTISFTAEELAEFQEIFTSSGMFAVYSI